jgi:hypothetical protein
MTSSGPPPKKSRLQTKSIATFFRPAYWPASSAEIENKSQKQPPSPVIASVRSINVNNDSRDISVAFKKSADNWIFDASVCLPDYKKHELLTNHVMPDDTFQWPYGLKTRQKVYLSKKHLTGKYDAFQYSLEMQDVVCVPCVLFGLKEAANERNKITPLGVLVTKPLRAYEKISETLNSHIGKHYHKTAQAKADGFLLTVKDPASRIDNQLDDCRKQQATENRKRLEPIVKTVIFCGRLGIALRGHRDDGALGPQKAIKGQEGNFRALLAYLVDSGDNTPKEHLVTASKKATYISKVTQNELIELCADEMLKQIVREIKAAIFFAVIADETTDTSGQEQLCLCVRYVDQTSSSVTVKEEFVGFMNMEDLSAESVGLYG